MTSSGIELTFIQVFVAYYDRAWNKGDIGTTPAFGAHTVPGILG
jgi:hypothetical protein